MAILQGETFAYTVRNSSKCGKKNKYERVNVYDNI